jgi:two-component system response regulator AtoC
MSESLILVVDDDAAALKALMQVLRKENYVVEGASSAAEAMQRLAHGPADLVITDIRMERMDGMELMRELHARWPNLPVIVMTAFASIDTAIRSIHEGAYDYISKPYEVDDLRLTVRRALEQSRLARENHALKQNLAEDKDLEVQMIGMSPPMVEVYKMIAKVAPTATTVLIEGESGSGKELIARAIHANSDRAKAPFIALNCGAVTESLLETELFGHVKGAFTGATFAKQGLFEAANKGTIFLDEIGETSAHMQTRLLRVLEEHEIQRVGSVDRTPVDIRVIAATNRPLLQMVKHGKFREDLFYRLNVVAINVPPLRERLADLPLLFDHFLKRYRRRTNRAIAVHGEVLDMLREYSWPGNVRELENMVERAVTLNTSGILTTADFREHLNPSGAPATVFSGRLVSLEEMERRYTAHVIARCNGNMTRAAEVLQIDRRTLYRMLERFSNRNLEETPDLPESITNRD